MVNLDPAKSPKNQAEANLSVRKPSKISCGTFRTSFLSLYVLLNLTQNTSAIALPPAAMTPATAPIIDIVRSTQFSELLESADGVSFYEFAQKQEKVIVVRFEGIECINDRCFTIFLNSIGNKIIGAGLFPNKVTISDQTYKICGSCEDIYTLTFEDTEGRYLPLNLSYNYVFIE